MESLNYQLESFMEMQKRIKVSSQYPALSSVFNWNDIGLGIQTSQDAKFYARTAKFDEKFNNEGKSLVVQFSVKHEQKIDCGGGYVKVNFFIVAINIVMIMVLCPGIP